MTLSDHQAAVWRAEQRCKSHEGHPRSLAYQKALLRLQDARHALLAAELRGGSHG